MEIVGLIPASGVAKRLGKLPCSKEIFPIMDKSGSVQVASANLIRYYSVAGIKEIFFIIRKGKWDIAEYYCDGSEHGVNIGYLMMKCPFGVPFTLSQAYPFVKDKIVALGFPDIVFKPEDAFQQVVSKLTVSDAEIILGIVPYSNPLKADMVVLDENGNIVDFVIKQNRPDLKYSWFIAVWKPRFTKLLKDVTDDYIEKGIDKITLKDGTVREMYIGDVILDGIKRGLKTDYVLFEDGFYRDIGDAEDLYKHITGYENM